MNYGDLLADNEDLPSFGGKMVPSNKRFQMLFKHILVDRIVQIFKLNKNSKESFEFLLDKKIQNSIDFRNIEDELFLMLDISNRYLMIRELIEKKSDINFGLFGILFYLGLTCFDSLGQKKEYIQYQDWLNSKKNKEVAEIEKLIRKSSESNLREELNNLYKNYYSPVYGVKNSFFSFLNSIKDKSSYKQLLLTINFSTSVWKQIKNDTEFTERFKRDWLFDFRNNFTHNTRNVRLPLENSLWKLSYKVKEKAFDINIKPNELMKSLLNCIKDGIEMKLIKIRFSFEYSLN